MGTDMGVCVGVDVNFFMRCTVCLPSMKTSLRLVESALYSTF